MTSIADGGNELEPDRRLSKRSRWKNPSRRPRSFRLAPVIAPRWRIGRRLLNIITALLVLYFA
jgi:hypothetical protein